MGEALFLQQALNFWSAEVLWVWISPAKYEWNKYSMYKTELQTCQYKFKSNPLKNSLKKKRSIHHARLSYNTLRMPKGIVLTVTWIHAIATLRLFVRQNKLDDDSKTESWKTEWKRLSEHCWKCQVSLFLLVFVEKVRSKTDGF